METLEPHPYLTALISGGNSGSEVTTYFSKVYLLLYPRIGVLSYDILGKRQQACFELRAIYNSGLEHTSVSIQDAMCASPPIIWKQFRVHLVGLLKTAMQVGEGWAYDNVL